MELITKRLKLTPITMDYLDDVFTNFNPEVCTYMFPKPATDQSETIAFILKSMENYELGKEIVFAALLKDTNEFIGCMGIHHIDTPKPELGVWTKASVHGNGYGLEGMDAIIEYAKNHCDFDYLVYPADRRNIPSRRIPESHGGVIVDRYHETGASGNELDILEYHIGLKVKPFVIDKKPLIIFDGDSITDAGRDKQNVHSLGKGYAKLFGDYFPDAIIRNHGVSGHRTRELLGRWDQTLALKPDVISILIGINDIWHFHKYGKVIEKDEYRTNLEKILKLTKETLPNCKIMLVEPFVYPIGEYELPWQADLNKEIKIVGELAQKYGCVHIHMQAALDCLAQSYSMKKILPDGVHPSDFGHKAMAHVMIKELSRFVEEFYKSL